MTDNKSERPMNFIPVSLLFLLWTKVNSSHYFTIPEGCKDLDDEYPVSEKSWTCVLVDHCYDMTCWFDIEQLFQQEMDEWKTYDISVYYEINGYYSNEIKTTGRCLKMVKSYTGMGPTTFNFTTPIRRENKTVILKFNNKIFIKPSKTITGFQYNSSQSSINLEWTLPKTLSEKETRIRYTSNYDKELQEENYIWIKDRNYITEMRFDNSLFRCNFTLNDLIPFTSYDIMIDIIILDNGTRTGYWSDVFKITIKTAEDVPAEVPTFYPGYFSRMNDSIYKLYWRPVSQIQRCGIITNYRVAVFLNNGSEENWKIMLPGDSISKALTLNKHQIYRIGLNHRTRIGYSHKSDVQIYIYPESFRPQTPGFTVEALSRSRVEVKWNGILDADNRRFKNVTSVTVVWCYGILPGSCSLPIESRTIQLSMMNTTQILIVAPNGNYRSYIYGISVEAVTEDGLQISSGIKWFSDCIFQRDSILPSLSGVKVTVLNTTGFLIKWEPLHCQDVPVSNYLVRYCMTVGNWCKGKMQLVSVPLNVSSHIVAGLETGKSYIIQVGVNLKYGGRNWSEPTIASLHAQFVDKAGRNQLVFWSVAGGSVACLILFAITIISCRRHCRMSDIEIKLPAISKQSDSQRTGISHPSETLINKDKPGGSDSGLGRSDQSDEQRVTYRSNNSLNSKDESLESCSVELDNQYYSVNMRSSDEEEVNDDNDVEMSALLRDNSSFKTSSAESFVDSYCKGAMESNSTNRNNSNVINAGSGGVIDSYCKASYTSSRNH